MADHSLIEWCDSTWNIITGCSVLSPGCRGCYAMKLAGTRLRNHPSRAGLTEPSAAGPVWNGQVRFNEQWLDQPQRWKRPREIFVCAHGDLFHENVPDDWIDQVFAVMGECPWHTFQVLTKRSARMRAYLSAPGVHDRIEQVALRLLDAGKIRFVDDDPGWPLSNVIMMVSAERQQEADERIPDLLATPAARRGVSLEPLLGPISLSMRTDRIELPPGLGWVITGGESGDRARPSHPDWFRSLRDQCAAAEVPFFLKQITERGRKLPMDQWPADLRLQELPA
jgi:protein gp37